MTLTNMLSSEIVTIILSGALAIVSAAPFVSIHVEECNADDLINDVASGTKFASPYCQGLLESPDRVDRVGKLERDVPTRYFSM